MSQERNDVIEGEIVEEERYLPATVPDTSLKPIDMGAFNAWAESRQQALEKLMEMGIAATNPEGWADMGGKPHPEQGACSSIINMVGIVISPPARRKETFEDEKGSYYMYVLEAEVTVPRFGIGPYTIVGRASSRDAFFAMRKGELRPQSEIDPGDILSKAYTNMRFRAVKAIVPEVSEMTWDRLNELTKGRVRKGSVKQIVYGEQPEEPAAEGNCPTCKKFNLKEIKKRDGSGSFWACEGGKYDATTKKRSGCQHTQNEPPAAPKQKEPEVVASTGEYPELPPDDKDVLVSLVSGLVKELDRKLSGINNMPMDALKSTYLKYRTEWAAKQAFPGSEEVPDPADGTVFEDQ